MSNSETDSNRPDGRGRSEGSRKTQFATGRQPEERRKPAGRKTLKASLLSELRQPVTLSKGGKFRKVEYLQALYHSISRDLLKASLSDRMKFVRDLDKLKLTGLLADQAKLDEERAEVEAEHRELARARHRDSVLADGIRYTEQLWREKWYAAAKLLALVRDNCEWGAGNEGLADDVEIICKAFERDVEGDIRSEQSDAFFKQILAHYRSPGELDDLEDDDSDDDDEWEDGDCDEGNYPRGRGRDEMDRHDPTTDGAIDYDPAEFDESTMPVLGDVNDPALDIATGQFGAEDHAPPTSSNEGEV